jgi:hypothetical protein
VGLEQRDPLSHGRGLISFQEVTREEYCAYVEPLVTRLTYSIPNPQAFETKKLYPLRGNLHINFEDGHVILDEPTVALVRRGGLLCWQAEMKVEKVIWEDESIKEQDVQSDHSTAQ